MKRIFYMFMAAFMMISLAANSQTIKNDGVFSHMYIGLNGGVNQSTVSNYSNWDNGFNSGLKTLTYNAGLELGKDVTPITGISIEGIYNNKVTTAKQTKLNRMDVFANAKFNLMNLFGGYNGMPRVFEIRTLTGIGLNHYLENYSNPNDIALQAGLEFDFNLGKNRNWYVTFTPAVQFNEINDGYKGVAPAFKNGDLKANLGIVYRFGSNDGSHNFVICDKTYTDEQYADLYAKYDEAMNRPVEVDTVVIEKVVEVVKTENVNLPSETYVYFKKGSADLDINAENVLNNLAKVMPADVNVKVVGSADSATGSKEVNQKLSNERANNVANVLKSLGVKNVNIETTLDVNENQEKSRSAVVFVIE